MNDYTDMEEVEGVAAAASHSPKQEQVVYVQKTKPWYMPVISITSNAEGAIHGLSLDGKVYIWHHSFVHAGKWVLHVTGR